MQFLKESHSLPLYHNRRTEALLEFKKNTTIFQIQYEYGSLKNSTQMFTTLHRLFVYECSKRCNLGTLLRLLTQLSTD